MTDDRALVEAFREAFSRTGDALARNILSDFDPAMPMRRVKPREVPVARWAAEAAASAVPETRELAGLFAAAAHRLPWGQSYSSADFGEDFLAGYGYVELFGTRGPFVSDALAGGCLLLAPGIRYPLHRHVAEELYLPLTGGSQWAIGDGPFVPRPAGRIIHHASNMPHAMHTGASPLLAAYLWWGGDLRQKSEKV